MTLPSSFFSYVLILLVALPGVGQAQQSEEWHVVPNQTFDVCKEVGEKVYPCEVTYGELSLSAQVTLGEYKKFLLAVKTDSSESFYRTLLPDSSILSPDRLNQYLTKKKYESFQVIGISWDAAMTFCRWKTSAELKDTSVAGFVYRLPTSMEWVAANYYLKENEESSLMDADYADWILDAYDESVFTWAKEKEFYKSYLYFHLDSDPPAMKRKRFIGNSFLRTLQFPLELGLYGYSFRGYRDVSFRMVRVPVDKIEPNSVTDKILKKWKVNL